MHQSVRQSAECCTDWLLPSVPWNSREHTAFMCTTLHTDASCSVRNLGTHAMRACLRMQLLFLLKEERSVELGDPLGLRRQLSLQLLHLLLQQRDHLVPIAQFLPPFAHLVFQLHNPLVLVLELVLSLGSISSLYRL